MFHEKQLQNRNQTEFRIEKIKKKKGDKFYVKWKGYDNSFNTWIDKKKIYLYKMSHFTDTYSHSKKKIKFELDLSNYATKSDLKSAAGTDTSKVAKQVYLANLISGVDKLYIA